MLKIDLTESFPLLARAPIVEAVIEVVARAEVPWEEQAIKERVKARLPDYPGILSGRAIQFAVEFPQSKEQSLVQAPVATQAAEEMGWRGLRCESADKHQIVQFIRDRYVFSRLAPYESWNRFRDEALRLWSLHMELAQPTEVQRLGLRFINSIAIPGEGDLAEFLQAPPTPLLEMELTFTGFLHKDTLAVPGHPYVVNFIKTIQPAQGGEGAGLILDIDVFTTQPVGTDQVAIERHLAEMRWLKNKIFFGSITPKAMETFK